MKVRNSEKIVNIIIDILLVLLGILALYPIWFVLIASVSSPGAISRGEVILFPQGLNFSAYESLFDNRQIWLGYRNTVLYTFFGVVIDLVVMIPCAYALSRSALPGGSFLMKILCSTTVLKAESLILNARVQVQRLFVSEGMNIRRSN